MSLLLLLAAAAARAFYMLMYTRFMMQGLLQLQQQMMRQQDEELGHMERAVHSTKHIALAIGEEVDLQVGRPILLSEKHGHCHSCLNNAEIVAPCTIPFLVFFYVPFLVFSCLQTRLLEGLEEDVEVTDSRMRAATQRVKQMMRQSSGWKGGLCIFVLIVALVVVLVLAAKLGRLFGG